MLLLSQKGNEKKKLKTENTDNYTKYIPLSILNRKHKSKYLKEIFKKIFNFFNFCYLFFYVTLQTQNFKIKHFN